MENSIECSEAPITFEDLGLKRADPTTQTLIGKLRTIESLTKWEWGFLGISLATLIASLGLAIQRLATLSKIADDYTFAILLSVTTAFCFYYVLRGVLQESLYEILVFLATVVILFVYCIANYILSDKNAIKLARLIGICVLGPVIITLGLWICKMYRESGNLVYRIVGANTELQNICRTLLLGLTFCVFDLQLQASILVLVLKNGTELSEGEKIVIGVGSAISVVYFITVFFSMKYELRYGMCIFWFLSIFEPGYVIYKMYNVNKTRQYSNLLKGCFFCATSVALIIRIFLVTNAVFVFKNFGKGLKEKVYGIKVEQSETASTTAHSISATIERTSSTEHAGNSA